ncbi:retinol dehydrogenase 13-like [Drosophila sulfurigaster albostrigata]|uniref:retinol dehydrogenase 13-like n=1 Tax=Drosophila sulfurigaster albostrigata TaxID=89887 RepID=UPI002D21B024|nr:retinol dehydrogenase 13-like [Drosophila sulfurigaster albostrigata]
MTVFAFLKSRPLFWLSVTGTAVGGACFVKDLMQGGQFTKNTDETCKIVIVTGSNTGIGKETVRELARRGATVYMACRDMEKCEEARQEIVLETQNKYVYCRQCDLASMDSIRNFVAAFKREQKKLDILINNAGVMRCPRSLTKDGFEMQIGVNHLGHFLLTNLMLDLLKKSRPSRIVVVSSLAHTRGEINIGDLNSELSYDEGKAYSQSKLANVLFTQELAKRLDGTGVTVNALHPGIVDTELFRHMGFFTNFFAGLFVKPLFWPFVKTPKSGAQTSLYVALDPELASVSGKYFSDCQITEAAPAAQDVTIAKWLWAVSEKWTRSEVIDINKDSISSSDGKDSNSSSKTT